METLFARRESGFQNKWVVRDQLGDYITHDKYSNDLRDRFSKPKFNLRFFDENGNEIV